MDIKMQRVEVFEDTMKWIESDSRLKEAVKNTQSKTKLYKAQEIPKISEVDAKRDMRVTVTKERSFEAAIRLKNLDKKVAVLNFASATNPGGGVTRGSNAQEEALCRCSTLYPCLNTTYLWKNYYTFHRNRHDTLYTDACIYTPGIQIIKTDTRVPERTNDWCEVDVISCAAPNLRFSNKITGKALLELHKQRAKKILQIAIVNGDDCVVLGAFGCGAFENPPEIVARAYKEVLPEYKGYFDEIRFAVYCTPKDTTNCDVFSRTMKGI